MTPPTKNRAKDDAPRPAAQGPVLRRVCDALRELRSLTEERAERLSALDQAKAQSTSEAQSHFEEQTVHAQSEFTSTRSAAWNEERQRHQEIGAEYDGVIKSQYTERKKLLDIADEKAANKLESIKQESVEARWLLESVHDSDVAQTHALAKGRLESLDAIRQDAAEALQARSDLHNDLKLSETSPDSDEAATPGIADVEDAIQEAQNAIEDARDALHRIERSPFPRVARGLGYVIFAIVCVLIGAAAGFAIGSLKVGAAFYAGIGIGIVFAIGSRFLLAALSRRVVSTQDERCLTAVHRATGLEQVARDQTNAVLRDRLNEIDRDTKAERKAIEDKSIERRERLEQQHTKRRADIHENYNPKIERLETRREEKRAEATARREGIEQQAQDRFDRLTVDSRAERDRAIGEAVSIAESGRRELDFRWREAEPRLRDECRLLQNAGQRHAPEWSQTTANHDPVPPPLARIGWARWDVPEAAAGKPIDWDGPRTIELPIPLEFPLVGSLLVEAEAAQRAHAIALMRASMLRVLTTLPPGKARFTIIDPIGLGESFAAFMHLADHQDQLVSGRIWTEPRHIEQRLLDLTEHMESVIQKYLRNDFPTIEAYNQAAGEIAEPYRFLVIADFPTNISEAAGKRIASIASSGARCGVHTMILRNPLKEPPKSINTDELRASSLTIRLEKDGILELVGLEPLGSARVQMDEMPDDLRTRELLREVGELSIDAGRVQVPFTAVGPGEGEAWTQSAAQHLRIPIGRSGASKTQQLVLGEGTAQHALIAGRTGSGKSTLFHVMITSCASWYSTDEVELYLVDFKKGVEFKPYATHALPHARVIAIETDRAFGFSVLQRIDQELTERGERMRCAEVQNLASFREKTGERMPRVLLIIDEFQELFVEDDQIAQQSAMLLDRIVRQGRAFGVHVVLGSQTLGGAYAINRATMSQMNVRIALQCDEQDSYLILGEDNAAARLLERPGEAVYNDQGGKVEANSPFQVVWLPDTVRDEALAELTRRAERSEHRAPEPIVFEGNAPADASRTQSLVTPNNTLVAPDQPVPLHLGVPVAIAPPVFASLERVRADNALVLSTNTETAKAMLAAALLGFDRFTDATPGAIAHVIAPQKTDDRHSLGAFAAGLPLETRLCDVTGITDTLLEVESEIDRRQLLGTANEPPVLVLIAGLHLCRDIKRSDDLGFSSFGDGSNPEKSPGQLLERIIQDGPELGVHALVWCDTLDAFERALDRRRMGEFSHRVLTQMNAMDSAAILDSPAASRLSQGRAIYYNDRTTGLVTLRPYAFPVVH